MAGSVEQLVYTASEDGIALEGAVFTPAESPRDLGVVFVHGLTGKFYSRPIVGLARVVAGRGYRLAGI